jgi:hypothetical protein
MGSLFFGRRCRHVPPLAGVMASALVITSCGSQSSQSGSLAKAVNGIPVGLAQTVNPSAYQVSFTSKTVDVDRATVAANLISVSPDGTYTFSGDSGALGQLAAGKTMLLEGTDVEDVTKVSHSGSHLVVETTPASLTDLITNGHIAFSAPMNASDAIGISSSGAVAPPSAPTQGYVTSGAHHAVLMGTDCTLDRLGGVLPTFSFTGSLGAGWQYRIGFSGCSGQINWTLTVCYGLGLEEAGGCISPSSGGGTAFQYQATGFFDWSSMNADMDVANGSVKSSSFDLSKLVTGYKMEAITSAGNTVQGTSLPAFRFPVGFEMPIEVGPIPFYLKVQAAILVHLGVSSKNSVLQASSSGSTTVSGGGVASGSASSVAPGSGGSASGSVSPGQSISAAGAAFTVAVQAPRIGFGLGVRLANILEFVDAVWSFGYLVGSAVALEVCASWDLTLDVGFQAEATLRFVAGPIKATSARVSLLSKDLAKGGTPGCPSI